MIELGESCVLSLGRRRRYIEELLTSFYGVKQMKKVVMLLMLAGIIASPLVSYADDTIPDVGVTNPVIDADSLEDGIVDTIGILPGVLSDLTGLKMTGIKSRPDADTPLVSTNAFGSNIANYLPDSEEVIHTSTFASKYKSYGRDKFDDGGAWMIGTTYKLPKLDTLGDNFYFNVTSVNPTGSGNQDAVEVDYTLFWTGTKYEGEKNEMSIMVKNVYYQMTNEDDQDGQEVGVSVAFTNMFNFKYGRLVPSIYVGELWNVNASSEDVDRDDSGAVYRYSVDYYTYVNEAGLSDLHLHADIATFDEYGDADSGQAAYYTLGASTSIGLSESIVLTPYVNYQINAEDKADTEGDEFWFGTSVNMTF